MDNIEKLIKAKMYIDKLAYGIDPITNFELPNDTILNNVRLSRCFFYVSEILRQVIDSNNMTKSYERSYKKDFYMTDEQKKKIDIIKPECYIKDFVAKINSITEYNSCKKFQAKWINIWLIRNGFLVEYIDNENRKHKKATLEGQQIGLKSTLRRSSTYGAYTVTILTEPAQRFIINNLDKITSESRLPENNNTAEYHGDPWTSNHDEILMDLYNKKVSIYEIAVLLKRTEDSIKARLKKLGINVYHGDPR